MEGGFNRKLLVLSLFPALFHYLCSSTDMCTNTILPGSKGDQGEVGQEGDQGRLGKSGPPGPPGAPGEIGFKGEVGHTGKMGPTGDTGEKGDSGLAGPTGLKGKAGTTCDCSRYRKVVGELDVNVGKLKNTVKFVKNVILGLRETEERYYLLVKEPRRFREALMNCKLRGGNLAMPKTRGTNRLIADYISHAGLTRVYIGLQAQGKDMDGARGYVYADSTLLHGFAAWSHGEEIIPSTSPPTNSSCVELLSTGTWGHTECDVTMFYICEFPKSRRRGGGGERGRAVPVLT
ncbi:collectin-10 [Lampris incognitus]|uniref:collectin-10 n=1 Tax=Lampris incognitus TaxID=2546036 RepID=UPI0024B4D42F|nr:collectin-10 [Lampris incognitus]